MANPAAKLKAQTHDTDLLMVSNVTSFKHWLVTKGFKVSDPDRANAARGVHYWVEVPNSKPVSVQEGCGRKQRYAQTHFRLRQLLTSYLASPVATAIKDIVRPQSPGQLQIVVSGKVQPPATNDAPAILKARAKDPRPYLLTDADITQALRIDSPIPRGVEVQHVFGVRIAGADRKGTTVVAYMKVYDSPDARRLVEVVNYSLPLLGGTDAMAENLFALAKSLPNATILVDVLGDGLVFLQRLQAFASPTVKRYGMTMGQALPKGGNAKRFVNRRTECSVLAAEAIRGGNLKLVLPSDSGMSDPLALLGSKIPYELNAEARYLVAKPSQIASAQLPTADYFDAICMAFHSVELPVKGEKSAPACANSTQSPSAPAKVMDQYLIDLRDDFAINCPLKQKTDEDLAAFANRRWVYAQAMVDARPV